MSCREWDRARRRRRAAPAGLLLAVLLAVATVLAVWPGDAGVSAGWWPRTGDAFAASPSTTASTSASSAGAERERGEEPCQLIVGPARSYCHAQDEPSVQSAQPSGPRWDARAAWTILPPLAGLTVMLALRIWGRLRAPRRRS